MKKIIYRTIPYLCMLALIVTSCIYPQASFAEESALTGDGIVTISGTETAFEEEEIPDTSMIPEPPAPSGGSSGSFVNEGDKTYYYYENGKMAQNIWITDGGKRYFASRSGAIVKNSFITVPVGEPEQSEEEGLKNYRQTVKYYMGSDGSMQSGIVRAGEDFYYCDPANDDRVRVNSWVEVGGKRYFASHDGSFYRNTFITFEEGVKYYMGSDGSVQSGIVNVEGKYYFCDPANDNRVRMNGWVETGGKRYFASPDGSFYTNTFLSFEPGVRYYVGTDGSVQNGVFYVNGKYYYGDPSKAGLIATNQWVNEDKKYYASEDGSFYTDCILSISSTEKYYLGTTGAVQTGINKYNGEYYYCDSAQGGRIVMNQWVEAGGNKYFASPSGAFYTNQFIHFGSTHYYMDAYGRVTLTPFEIRGITINPDPVTGAITQAEYDSIYDYRSPLPYSDYVLVDIPSQTLRYYVNGFEALFTYVVTGDYYQHPTPTGTFWLNGGKTQNATLIGEDYETFVNYWMPFIGGAYGMHDATWRSYFGGTIYKGNGSHGCVNMPFEKAKELYFMIPVGTMIIIR